MAWGWPFWNRRETGFHRREPVFGAGDRDAYGYRDAGVDTAGVGGGTDSDAALEPGGTGETGGGTGVSMVSCAVEPVGFGGTGCEIDSNPASVGVEPAGTDGGAGTARVEPPTAKVAGGAAVGEAVAVADQTTGTRRQEDGFPSGVARIQPTPLQHHDPETHARALLAWLQDAGVIGAVLATEVMEIHMEMCCWHGWELRPWNPVSAALTKLTTGRKTYRWQFEGDGARHRRRVFWIQARAGAVTRLAGLSRAA